MNDTNDSVTKNVVFAAPSRYKLGTGLDQMASEVPSSAKVTVLPPRLKLTPYGSSKAIRRNAILASHWYNLPWREGAITVPYIYKVLVQKADNYQRTHNDAFFEAYPDLLIDNTASEVVHTTSELRTNYRKYCKRVAHEVFHYTNAMTALCGSLANMILLGKVNGDGYFKDFAQYFKWSKLNTETNWFARFVKPNGLEDYILNYSRFAIGRSKDQTDIVSVPLWKTDVYGNVGYHALPVDNFVHSDGTRAGVSLLEDESTAEANIAKQLAKVIVRVQQQYASTDITEDASTTSYVSHLLNDSKIGTNDRIIAPLMPRIENPTQINASYEDTVDGETVGFTTSFDMNTDGALFKSNLSISEASDTNVPAGEVIDNIFDKVWDTWQFWKKYCLTYFDRFTDPNSDWYNFFQTEIPLYKKSKTPQDYLNVIRASDAFQLPSLLECMAFKKNNQPNTATIVTWAPLFDDGNIASGPTYRRDENFDMNYDRYECDNSNATDMLYSALEFPGVAPRVFPNTAAEQQAKQQPIVMNTIPAIGLETTARFNKTVVAPVGKFATMLDMASIANIYPELTGFEGIGITDDELLAFAKANDAICFEELPFTPFVYQKPLIDTSDPYQCGFNVLVSYNDPVGNEWKDYLCNPQNYDSAGLEQTMNETMPIGEEVEGTTLSPTCTSFGRVASGSRETNLAHIANQRYLNAMRHALVFVGRGIVDHPFLKGNYLTAGNPVGQICDEFSSSPVAAITGYLSNALRSIDSITAFMRTQPGSMSVSQLILLSSFFAGAVTRLDHPVLCGGPNGLFAWRNKLSETNIIALATQYFKASYGLVAIMTYNMAEFNINPLEIAGRATIAAQTFSSGNIVPSIANKSVGSSATGGDYTVAKNTRMSLWDSVVTGARFWLWFLDKIHFPKVYLENGVPRFTEEEEVSMPGFSGAEKAPLAMASRHSVMFTGVEDTTPYWSIKIAVDATKAPDINPATISYLPTNDLVVEPRKPIGGVGNAKGEQTPKAEVIETSNQQARAAVGSGKSAGDKSNRHANKRKGKPFWKHDHKKIADEKRDDRRTQDQVPPSGFETPNIQLDVEKKEKVPPATASTQSAMQS